MSDPVFDENEFDEKAIYSLVKMPPDLDGIDRRYGAYWLHPDGWYRLYPPVAPRLTLKCR